MKRFVLALLSLLLAGAAGAQSFGPTLPTCGATPFHFFLTKESAADDCTDDPTNAGSTTACCRCMNSTWSACDAAGGGGGGAPTGAEYVTTSADGTLSAERVATDTATVDADAGTAGQFKLNLIEAGAEALLEVADLQGDLPIARLGSFTSADLRAGLSDELGSGFALFAGCSGCIGATEAAGLDAGDLTTGTLATARLGSGSADSTKFLRGDQTWATTSDSFAPYGQFDPNRPPASLGTGGIADEFTGDTNQLTYQGWQNQESSTVTYTMDGALYVHPADATGFAAHYLPTGPDGSSVDWTWTVTIVPAFDAASNAAGIGVLATGTMASPTLMHTCIIFYNSTFMRFSHVTYTGYTAGGVSLQTQDNITQVLSPYRWFIQMRYTSATKAMSCGWSMDGTLFNTMPTATLAAHPSPNFFHYTASFNASNASNAFFPWTRIRTGSDRDLAGE